MNNLDDSPPVAALRPHSLVSRHGTRVDPYYWLRDDKRENPEILAYLAAENAYGERQMAAAKPLENTLFQEITGRLRQDDSSVPQRKNGYWYYTRYVQGMEQPIYARRKDSQGAPEQILLDANELATGHEYYQIGDLEVSPDAKWLAFCEDLVGRRQYRLRFKDLSNGEILPGSIDDVEADLAWANDNRTVLYVEKDPETLLGLNVKKHVVGSDPAHDVLVFHQTDKSFYTSVLRSRSDRFLYINMESTVSSEWRYADAGDPDLKFKVFLAHRRDHEYHVADVGDKFIVRTNWRAKNFRLMEVPIGKESNLRSWRDVVAHRDDTFIQDFEVFDHFIALSVRSGGLMKIAIKPQGAMADAATQGGPTAQGGSATNGGMAAQVFFIASDEAAYTTSISANPDIHSDLLRYSYSSLATPTSIYDYDVRTGKKTLLKRDPVIGDFDPEHYTTEFVFAPARDGKAIPVSLVYRKGLASDGTAPVLLYGYGSYGLSMDPNFSSARLSLIDRGFVFAIAHVRGGQEMGRAWYDDGRLLHKNNSFTDFIDVTHYLVAERYAAKDKVFAMGGSAGGLLMGAVANMSPRDYRAIIAQVPFVDVVTTMLDDTIPLTSNEYDEWGNPANKKYYDYLLTYSPYDNIRAQGYPAMWVTTGLWDSQVQYYEPTKWVAKLRSMKTDSNPLVLYVDMESGHGGKSGRFQRYRVIAKEYAFILNLLGVHQ